MERHMEQFKYKTTSSEDRNKEVDSIYQVNKTSTDNFEST